MIMNTKPFKGVDGYYHIAYFVVGEELEIDIAKTGTIPTSVTPLLYFKDRATAKEFRLQCCTLDMMVAR